MQCTKLLIISYILINNIARRSAMNEYENIPKEILDQYPYGEFPIRYTKSGQESIRRESENRFSYAEPLSPPPSEKQNNILEILPILQLMSGKKDSKEMFKILSKLLFKDNKEMEQIASLLMPTISKSQEIKPQTDFPDANKVNISSLKRI